MTCGIMSKPYLKGSRTCLIRTVAKPDYFTIRHPERSEGSLLSKVEILRSLRRPQNDFRAGFETDSTIVSGLAGLMI